MVVPRAKSPHALVSYSTRMRIHAVFGLLEDLARVLSYQKKLCITHFDQCAHCRSRGLGKRWTLL